jgi:hypothetical protein
MLPPLLTMCHPLQKARKYSGARRAHIVTGIPCWTMGQALPRSPLKQSNPQPGWQLFLTNHVVGIFDTDLWWMLLKETGRTLSRKHNTSVLQNGILRRTLMLSSPMLAGRCMQHRCHLSQTAIFPSTIRMLCIEGLSCYFRRCSQIVACKIEAAFARPQQSPGLRRGPGRETW